MLSAYQSKNKGLEDPRVEGGGDLYTFFSGYSLRSGELRTEFDPLTITFSQNLILVLALTTSLVFFI